MTNYPITPDQVEVTEEMLAPYRDGYMAAFGTGEFAARRAGIAAVFAHIANNPPVPTEEQIAALSKEWGEDPRGKLVAFIAQRWMQMAFLKREPELPAEVGEAITRHFGSNPEDWVKALAKEAYELGLKKGGK